MNCRVIRDLLSLYIDECCSEESAAIVKEHLENCQECRELYERMKEPLLLTPAVSAPVKMKRLNDWRASVLQSVLFFVSFAAITVGVALEASTPSGLINGFWAFCLVIPATGFLLSLANWFFVSVYKSRKHFSNGSLLATLTVTVGAYIWAGFHYEISIVDFVEAAISDGIGRTFSVILALANFYKYGIFFTALCCVLSKVLSNKYAKMLGKE